MVGFHFEHIETEKDYEFLTKIPHAKFQIKKARQKVSIKVVSFLNISREKLFIMVFPLTRYLVPFHLSIIKI